MLKRNIIAKQNCIRFLATATANTVDQQEIQQFQKFVAQWWEEFGPMKALHSMNKLRVPLIRDGLVNAGSVRPDRVNTPLPLKELSILDVGCGGGILSEPLARLGASVTGIDANSELITVARSHADLNRIDLNYVTTSIEDHAAGRAAAYDAVVASEIIEHVTEKSAFVEACVKCLKPGGSFFATTFNKTKLAEFFAIFLAEDVARLVPKGTHQYEKFVEPVKLQRMLEDSVSGLLRRGLRVFGSTFRLHLLLKGDAAMVKVSCEALIRCGLDDEPLLIRPSIVPNYLLGTVSLPFLRESVYFESLASMFCGCPFFAVEVVLCL